MNRKKLLNNTIMLYLLTASNYLFSFITVPYQTRVIGPELYGNIGFASAFMVYFSLTLDFGFLLSATEEVSRNREDRSSLSRILTSVTVCKLLLALISCAVFAVLFCFIGRLREDPLLFALYFLSALVSAFLPDYLYRGLEEMRAITLRSVGIRLFFTLMIFAFLKRPEQYYMIPLFTLLGNIGALLFVYLHVTHRLGIPFCRTERAEIGRTFRRASMFFYSRIASTVYSATNTFVLGMLYGNSSSVVGFYTAADKLVSTGKQGMTPVVDSLYPHMIARKDYKIIKYILIISMPIITAGCVIIAVFAYDICALLFGEAFRGAGIYLRYMTPVLWCAFPAMLFGFPVMSPLGLTKYTNWSNIFGAALQLTMLLGLFAAGAVTALHICIITCITELATTAFRIGVVGVHVWRERKKRGALFG